MEKFIMSLFLNFLNKDCNFISDDDKSLSAEDAADETYPEITNIKKEFPNECEVLSLCELLSTTKEMDSKDSGTIEKEKLL